MTELSTRCTASAAFGDPVRRRARLQPPDGQERGPHLSAGDPGGAADQSLIGDYGGHVQHVAGDGILALFECPAEALQFAIAIQREFRNEAVWQGDDEPIAFRIGINVGEVLLGGEASVQGHSVNIAARLQALAQPGGICVTSAVQRAVRDTLGIAMRQLGPQSLKNIAEPVEVFAIEVNGTAVPVSAELRPTPSEIIKPFTEASVAVLPLDNLSNDPRNGHLCDGITGDIITNLSVSATSS